MQQRQDVKLQIMRHSNATLMKQGLECTFMKLTYFNFKSLIFWVQRCFSFTLHYIVCTGLSGIVLKGRKILVALDCLKMFFAIQSMQKLTKMTGCVSTDDGPKELGITPLDSANGSLTGFGGIRPGSHQLHSQVTIGMMACSKHEEG